MDPLSIAAGVIAVITAAGTALQGIRKLADARKYGIEIESLVSELDAAAAVVRDIYQYFAVSRHRACCEDLLRSLVTAQRKCELIRGMLLIEEAGDEEKEEENQERRKRKLSCHDRLRWFLKRSTIISMRDEIRNLRFDLLLRLSIVGTATLDRLEELLTVSTATQQSLLNRVNSILDQEGGRPIAVKGSSQNKFDCVAIDKCSDDLSAECQNYFEHDQLARPVCKPWCSCRCHSHYLYRLSWPLRMIFGDLKVHFYGQIPDCNERLCERSGSAGLNAVYHFPAYLIRRYLVVKVRNNMSNGLNMSLSIPRIMPWSHLLWFYSTNGEELAVQRLFAQGQASPHDLNEQGSNAMIYASANLHLSKLLLQQKADPHITNEFGLSGAELLWEKAFAGRFGSKGPSLIGSMLQDFDCLETKKFSVLHKIILGLSPKHLRVELEESTANINAQDNKNRTPLIWAAMRNDEAAVQTLLDFGAAIDARDYHGRAPLHLAHSTAVCKLLLQRGANVQAVDLRQGRSSLHYVCSGMADPVGTEVGVIDLLIDAGLDVNKRDWDNKTPLHQAIFWGHPNNAKRLLDRGADPNVPNWSSHENAMHVALTLDRHAVIPSLLAKNANYTASNKYGRNIAHLAARFASTKTIQLLTSSNLANLDLNIRDCDGMTPADYIASRTIFHDSEIGVKEAFAEFCISVNAAATAEQPTHAGKQLGIDHTSEELMPESDPRGREMLTPGAYLHWYD